MLFGFCLDGNIVLGILFLSGWCLVFVASCRLQNGNQSLAFATNLCNLLLPFVKLALKVLYSRKNKILKCKKHYLVFLVFLILVISHL